jgi:hypothetical protein
LPLFATVAVVAAVGIFIWFQANRSPPLAAFDGHWNVSVHSKKDCLNNDPASYSVFVRDGEIDEPDHRLPKKGSISPDGAFKIEVSNRQGRHMNTQTGKITAETGEGRFLGAKPGCIGLVEIRRAK